MTATRTAESKRKPARAPQRRARVTAKPARTTAPKTPLAPQQRRAMIAEAAYYRAERRGFAPGGELADRLAAEADTDAQFGAPALVEHQLAHSDT